MRAALSSMRFLDRHARRMAFVLAALFALAACNKEEKKPIPQEENKATAVPSGMVFNDFLPSGGGGQGLAVIDGGVEAGLGVAEDGAGGAEAEASGAPKITVIDPGAEPRTVRRYAFVANRSERRVLTLRQSEAVQGQMHGELGLVMTLDIVAKEVKPTGTRFEMKLVKVDLADKDKLDPRLVQDGALRLAAVRGMSATCEVNARGEAGEVSVGGTEKMQRDGAEMVLAAFSQLTELVVPPLPDTAIGQGAKWERTETASNGELELQSKRTFELKDVNNAGGTILATMETKIPKRAHPRLPGATVEIDGSGTLSYVFRFDRIATNVVHEQMQRVKFEAPAGPDPKAPKKTEVQEIKVTHTLETPAGK
jgi:hypothetical protein